MHQIPKLDRADEEALFARFFDHDDLDAARTLVMAHLRYVVYEARRFSGYGIPLEDLIQQGNIGLMHSVKRFEPSRGLRLLTFAALDPCRNDGLRSEKLAANESRHDQSSEKVVFQPEKNDQFLGEFAGASRR